MGHEGDDSAKYLRCSTTFHILAVEFADDGGRFIQSLHGVGGRSVQIKPPVRRLADPSEIARREQK